MWTVPKLSFHTPAPFGMDRELPPASNTAHIQPRQVTNVLPGDPAATARLFFFYVALSCYCVNVSIRNTPTQALCLRSSKLLATVQLKTSSEASKGRWLSHLPGKTFASQHHTSHIHTETIRLTRHTSGYFVFFPIITPDAVAQVGWQIILSPHTWLQAA